MTKEKRLKQMRKLLSTFVLEMATEDDLICIMQLIYLNHKKEPKQ